MTKGSARRCGTGSARASSACMADRIRRAFAAILLLAGASPAAVHQRPPQSLGFTYEEDRLYVPVGSAAGRLGDFILDTGAPATFVDSGLRQRLGLRIQARR